MRKAIDPIHGAELLMILWAMRHADEIAIVDGNYPADAHAKRLVRIDGDNATRIVDAIHSLMPLEDRVELAAFRQGLFNDPDHREPIMQKSGRSLPNTNRALPSSSFWAKRFTTASLPADGGSMGISLLERA
jgi:L-fucose mutarotase/ribose pyranase (RbsD/FucU family)